VTGARLLATGESLPYEVNLEVHEQPEPGVDPLGELRIPAPRPSDAPIDVIAIDFA
jgi:alpha-L-fucosidase